MAPMELTIELSPNVTDPSPLWIKSPWILISRLKIKAPTLLIRTEFLANTATPVARSPAEGAIVIRGVVVYLDPGLVTVMDVTTPFKMEATAVAWVPPEEGSEIVTVGIEV